MTGESICYRITRLANRATKIADKSHKPKLTTDKVRPNWLGPYIVLERLGNQTYILVPKKGKENSKLVHGRFMRYYRSTDKPTENLELWSKSGNDDSIMEVEKILEYHYLENYLLNLT